MTTTFSTLPVGTAVVVTDTTAPASADIAPNQLFIWFDATDGAAKLMFKGKSADGTVVVGEVALT